MHSITNHRCSRRQAGDGIQRRDDITSSFRSSIGLCLPTAGFSAVKSVLSRDEREPFDFVADNRLHEPEYDSRCSTVSVSTEA
jgi:hypothetical protein